MYRRQAELKALSKNERELCYLNLTEYISRVERKTMVTQTYFWNPFLGATWTPL